MAIQDFSSPTIIQRLKQHAGSPSPQSDDWRAMVDSVMIDSAYDGQGFNIVLADVPERKTDLVSGEYELDAPSSATTVAVKVTDMRGEEVLEVRRVSNRAITQGVPRLLLSFCFTRSVHAASHAELWYYPATASGAEGKIIQRGKAR